MKLVIYVYIIVLTLNNRRPIERPSCVTVLGLFKKVGKIYFSRPDSQRNLDLAGVRFSVALEEQALLPI